MGDMKAKIESEIIALQTKYHATKILQTLTTNADCDINMRRQETTSYQHAQY
jgi:hypothetical protein